MDPVMMVREFNITFAQGSAMGTNPAMRQSALMAQDETAVQRKLQCFLVGDSSDQTPDPSIGCLVCYD